MHNTTYFPRIIHTGGKRKEYAPGLSGYIGNFAACDQKVRELRASFKAEGLPFTVRRYHCNYVTYR